MVFNMMKYLKAEDALRVARRWLDYAVAEHFARLEYAHADNAFDSGKWDLAIKHALAALAHACGEGSSIYKEAASAASAPAIAARVVVKKVIEIECPVCGSGYRVDHRPFGATSCFGNDKGRAVLDMRGEWERHCKEKHPELLAVP